MIATFNIKSLRINLVLRHKFEDDILSRYDFKDWKIAIWFRKYRMVGVSNFKDPSKWKANLVGSYMFGFEFLIFRAWIEFSKGSMHLEL